MLYTCATKGEPKLVNDDNNLKSPKDDNNDDFNMNSSDSLV